MKRKNIKELLRRGKKTGASEKELKISFFRPFSVGIFSSCTSNTNGGTFTFDITNNAILCRFFPSWNCPFVFVAVYTSQPEGIDFARDFLQRESFCNHKVRFQRFLFFVPAINFQFRPFTTLYQRLIRACMQLIVASRHLPKQTF